MTRRAEGWPAQVTGAIGKAVRYHRDERKWSGERLIRELDSVGFTMTRPALTNLEAGRRESIGVHEVYALAAVLGIPPLALLVPDLGADVAVMPGMTVDAVRTVGWITGTHLDYRIAFVADDDHSDPQQRYAGAGQPFDELRDHDAIAADVVAAGGLAGADRAAVSLYRHRLWMLRDTRAEIVARGWPLPPLPPELDPADIDQHDPTPTEETRS